MVVIDVVIVIVSVLLLELIQRESKCFGNLKEILKDLLKDFPPFPMYKRAVSKLIWTYLLKITCKGSLIPVDSMTR